ncbi:MAG: carboxypeptidase regulatory-like domain-containing protein [Bryobacterales bacterium]|nr:carboxypeptidase regulatory-like domain-containing protein [Bryobacterales bacterium]
MRKRALHLTIAIAFAVLLGATFAGFVTGQTKSEAVRVGSADIGGVVTGSKGPEAGVWVIAETTELPTKFVRIVVTDDQGRYLVPDLPKATYDVWVRGYGLVDSPKTKAAPGKAVNLKAVTAPDKKAAVEYYPALYWFSLLQVPPKSDFPGTGPSGNGIGAGIKSQGQWIRDIVNTDGCTGCHQMGDKATREIPKSVAGQTKDSNAAWDLRIKAGQAGGGMSARFSQVGRDRALAMYADWSDRIARGELPDAAPSRPQGKERNVVVTLWDWADPKVYLHDAIASDKRNPAVNPNGPIYGALEESGDYLTVLDPKTNSTSKVQMKVRDPQTPSSFDTKPAAPSPYWGDEAIWNSQTTVHSFSMDKQARVWAAARVRKPQTPAWCRAGSDHPSAKLFPINQGQRGLELYDPKTKETTTIDTCYTWGHVNFDDNGVLWSSFGPTGVEGWFDTRIWDKTHDEKQSQGWSAFILDYNGNGKRDAYTEPNQPADPAKDKRIDVSFYGVAPAPDGSVWGSVLGMPGALVRFVPGAHPPDTALAEYYEVPWNNPKAPVQGFAPRGMDVDSKGVVWAPLSSGHYASFDRRKCKGPLNGPAATGQQCPEGWTLYAFPGPNYKGAVENGSADSAYYNFVDRFDMLGMGKDVPLATGNLSEGLLVLVDGKFLTLRVPYPMGYYAKGLDGRIDNPNGGWKAKGIYTPISTRAPFHMEGGKGTTSKLVKFQMRPDPLAD